jgi:hypothetical protein
LCQEIGTIGQFLNCAKWFICINQLRTRTIMKLNKYALLLGIGIFCFVTAKAQLPSLSKKEIKERWTLLFDGRTFDGWQKADGTSFNGKGWKIENGVISVNPQDGGGGDIVTTKEFSDFELSLDFKMVKGTNSGVKYFLIKNTSLGCEYQLIDDENHPDAKLGKNGDRSLGGVYDIMPPSVDKKSNPLGEWNNMQIVVKGNHVEHWLNGKKILEYERGSEQFKSMIAESKFKTTKGFAEATQSAILLQEHGDIIYFRNIKIRSI